MVESFGYFFALVVGVILGLIGSGGSILAVPIFVYFFLMDEKLATAYSLFVVGFSALVGSAKQYSKGFIDFRTVLVFGIPAILGVSLVRLFLMPLLPDELFKIGQIIVSRRMGILGLFAVVMVPAAFSMLAASKSPHTGHKISQINYNYPLFLIEGLIVGGVTGMIGAGGGFLIIPVLVVFGKIEIRVAIGTSLAIVTLKSLIGFFIGDVYNMEIDWPFLLSFTGVAGIGVLIGNFMQSLLEGPKLRKGFGYFLLLISFFIVYMEFLRP